MAMLLDRPLREGRVRLPAPPPAAPEPKPVPTFQGTLEERMAAQAFDGIMMIVGRTDVPVVMWYRDNPDEVARAREVFDETKATGALLYATEVGDAPGATREQIRNFDETAEQIVSVPRFVGG